MSLADENRKRTLLVIRHSPYGSSLAKASVDVALAMAAFEQDVDILFMGEGVLQLVPGQDSHSVGLKNISRLLGSLPLYDVSVVYADAEAAARYNLDVAEQSIDTKALTPSAIRQLMVEYDHLLGF